MTPPKDISHPLAESLAYIIVAILALCVIARAGKEPRDPVSPDFRIAEVGR